MTFKIANVTLEQTLRRWLLSSPKALFRLSVLVLFFLGVHAFSQNPALGEPNGDQAYLEVYLKIYTAEHLEKNGDTLKALNAFTDCFTQLLKIREQAPDWETALVLARLSDCKMKILALRDDLTKSGVPFPVSSARGDILTTKYAPLGRIHEWKTSIRAALFWIGENQSNDDALVHLRSAWDPNWKAGFGGEDDPSNRNGYAPASHAPLANPFYVALPFDDLSHPELAHQWVPADWTRPPVDGQPVSACKNRWVEIKTAQRTCYAQWEDAGPVQTDRAAYVFGHEALSPTSTAGLSISPAVTGYLGMDGPGLVSWCLIDDVNLPPGAWLKCEEHAAVFRALQEQGK